jgi:hypothetical protein
MAAFSARDRMSSANNQLRYLINELTNSAQTPDGVPLWLIEHTSDLSKMLRVNETSQIITLFWPWLNVLLYGRPDLYLSHPFPGGVLVITCLPRCTCPFVWGSACLYRPWPRVSLSPLSLRLSLGFYRQSSSPGLLAKYPVCHGSSRGRLTCSRRGIASKVCYRSLWPVTCFHFW